MVKRILFASLKNALILHSEMNNNDESPKEATLNKKRFMYLNEANDWLLNSLRVMALGAKEVLLVQIRKQMGENEPMQDHLVEAQRLWIFEKSSGEDCVDFLRNVSEALNYAVEHERQAAGIGLTEEETMVMDMLFGFVNNTFSPEYVEAAKKIVPEIKKMVPLSYGPRNDENKLKFQRAAGKKIAEICKSLNVNVSFEGQWTITEGYVMNWLERIYDESK